MVRGGDRSRSEARMGLVGRETPPAASVRLPSWKADKALCFSIWLRQKICLKSAHIWLVTVPGLPRSLKLSLLGFIPPYTLGLSSLSSYLVHPVGHSPRFTQISHIGFTRLHPSIHPGPLITIFWPKATMFCSWAPMMTVLVVVCPGLAPPEATTLNGWAWAACPVTMLFWPCCCCTGAAAYGSFGCGWVTTLRFVTTGCLLMMLLFVGWDCDRVAGLGLSCTLLVSLSLLENVRINKMVSFLFSLHGSIFIFLFKAFLTSNASSGFSLNKSLKTSVWW